MPFRPADDFEIEYYLTPDGWKRGSEWFFWGIAGRDSSSGGLRSDVEEEVVSVGAIRGESGDLADDVVESSGIAGRDRRASEPVSFARGPVTVTGLWRSGCVCGSVRLRRVGTAAARRNAIERMLGLIALPGRCEDCTQRCFKWSWVRPGGGSVSGPVVAKLKKVAERAIDESARAFDRGTGDSDLN